MAHIRAACRCAVLTLALIGAVAAPAGAAQGPPGVFSTHVDLASHQALITGYNFGDSPQVFYGGYAQVILASTPTTILLAIPAGMPAGNYFVTV